MFLLKIYIKSFWTSNKGVYENKKKNSKINEKKNQEKDWKIQRKNIINRKINKISELY